MFAPKEVRGSPQFESTSTIRSIFRGLALKDEFRELFNSLPIGAAILTRDQEIRYVNPAFCEFLDYPRDELVGHSILEFTHSYDEQKLEEGLEQLYRGTRRYLELETCYTRSDGQPVWGFPVRMLHPNPAADEEETILMLVVDITERRQLEKQLRRTDRMSALGMLAGSIAHDFNNVLTIISTFAQLLETRPDDAELLDEGVERIRDACEQGQQLTHQLLEFGRRESSTLEVIDVNSFVRDVKTMFDRVLPPDIEVELSLSPDGPRVVTNEGRLHQVLMNLVINARDAIGRKGRITIETTPVAAGDSEVPGADALGEDEYTRLRICDTGAGMSPDMVPRIFEPYFTTKSDTGTGIGLTTVYGIVEEDKGYIRVDTQRGEGSCFDIFLPASRRARNVEERDDGGSRLTLS